MAQRSQATMVLLLLSLYVAACDDSDTLTTNNNSTPNGNNPTANSEEPVALTTKQRCNNWNTKLGQKFCKTAGGLNGKDVETACKDATGSTASLEHTSRFKNNICPLMPELLETEPGADYCDQSGGFKPGENPFVLICADEVAVNCIYWQDELIKKLNTSGFSCDTANQIASSQDTQAQGQRKELHNHCTSAIGSSSDQTKRGNVCDSFAGATNTGEVFHGSTSSLAQACASYNNALDNAVFHSFAKACFNKTEGFAAKDGNFELVEQHVRKYKQPSRLALLSSSEAITSEDSRCKSQVTDLNLCTSSDSECKTNACNRSNCHFDAKEDTCRVLCERIGVSSLCATYGCAQGTQGHCKTQ